MRQEPVGSEAISRSTNSFFPRVSATLAHPSQSSQSIRSPFDNEPIPAAKFTFKLEKNKLFEHRKTLIPASPAERMARSLAKLPVPTLQEELVAMSAKMAVMELELQAAKDALKCQESQRQCVMCFERVSIPWLSADTNSAESASILGSLSIAARGKPHALYAERQWERLSEYTMSHLCRRLTTHAPIVSVWMIPKGHLPSLCA